jgi:hypothetical protein
MIDGQTLIFSSSDIIWEEYSSVSSSKKTKTNSVPILLISVKGLEQKIVLRGKSLIKTLLSGIIDGWAELPCELQNHLMAEHEWLDGEEVPRFIDEIASFNAPSRPVSVSVVGHTAMTLQPSIGVFGTAFLVEAVHTRSPHQDFNITWLSDYIASPLEYGYTRWVGGKGKRTIPVAFADISVGCESPASLVVYDFGGSYGVVSRLNIGVRPHRLIEVKRGEGEIYRLKTAVIQSYAKCVEMSRKVKSKPISKSVDMVGLRSLEIDELEFSLGSSLIV